MKALLWHFVTEYLVYGKTNETLNLKNVLSFILNPEISIFNWKLEKKKKKSRGEGIKDTKWEI